MGQFQLSSQMLTSQKHPLSLQSVQSDQKKTSLANTEGITVLENPSDEGEEEKTLPQGSQKGSFNLHRIHRLQGPRADNGNAGWISKGW